MDENIEIFTHLWEHAENEVVEFKTAETGYNIDELGKYFSALSNEANLREREFGWIVFGVWDKKHEIVGTSFKDGEVALNKLKQDMSQHTTDGLIFREIIPLEVEGKLCTPVQSSCHSSKHRDEVERHSLWSGW